MTDAAIDGRDNNTRTGEKGRDGDAEARQAWRRQGHQRVHEGGGETAACGEAGENGGDEDWEPEARIMLLEYNIECLDKLIERYGGNRSLANIRASEESILKELRKKLGK